MKNFYTRFIVFTLSMPLLFIGSLETGLYKGEINTISPAANYVNNKPKVPTDTKPLPKRKINSEVLNRIKTEITTPAEIKPLPLRPLPNFSKALPVVKSLPFASIEEYFKYDSIANTFSPVHLQQQSNGADPLRFYITSNKDSVAVGEEVELTIHVELLPVTPQMMFTMEELRSYSLKVIMPEGFIQTGGDYYDFVSGKIDESNPKKEYKLKGVFDRMSESNCFLILRGQQNVNNALLMKKGDFCLKGHKNSFVSSKQAIKIIEKPFETKEFGSNITHKIKEQNLEKSVYATNEVIVGVDIQIMEATYDCISNSSKLKIKFTNTTNSGINLKFAWHVRTHQNSCVINDSYNSSNGKFESGTAWNWGYSGILVGNGSIEKEWTEIGRVYNPHLDININGTNYGNEGIIRCSYTFTFTDLNTPSIIASANPSLIVIGQNSTLSFSGCSGGTVSWSPQVPPNLIVNPSTTTTYTATCNLNTCSATGSTTVTVTNCPTSIGIEPTNPTIGSNLSVTGCIGGVITWEKDGQPVSDANNVQEGIYIATCTIPNCPAIRNSKRIFFTCNPSIPIPSQLTYFVNTNELANVTISNTNGCPRGNVIWSKKNINNVWVSANKSGLSVDLPVGEYKAMCYIDDSPDCYSDYSDVVTVQLNPNTDCYAPKPVITGPTVVNGIKTLSTTSTCFSVINNIRTNGILYWYKNNNELVDSNTSSIGVEAGNTYYVQCNAGDQCRSVLSEGVPITECSVSSPTINGPSEVIIPLGQTTTLITSSVCAYNGTAGYFEWYKNGVFIGNDFQLNNADVGCYVVYCKINDDCYAKSTNTVCVKNSDCSSAVIFAYSNANTGPCAVSVGETLTLNGGLEDGVSFEEAEWWFGGVKIASTAFYTLPNPATMASQGNYKLRIKKNGVWCEKEFFVPICPCSFTGGPSWNVVTNSQTGQEEIAISAWTNKPVANIIFDWTLPNGTHRTAGNFNVPKTVEYVGNYNLKMTYGDCVVEKSFSVNVPVPPNYNGIVSNAYCDNISGWITDSNNPGRQISNVIVQITKPDNNIVNIPVTVTPYNYFQYNLPATYKDGQTYTVKVKFPDPFTTFVPPYNSTGATIKCCRLALSTTISAVSNCSNSQGNYTVYFTNHVQANALSYRLLKKTYNSTGESIYLPVSNTWSVIPAGTPNVNFVRFTGLERGFYKVEIVEGLTTSDLGCKIESSFTIDCINPDPGCSPAPLITVVPNETIRESSGVTPILYAEPFAAATSSSLTGLGSVAKMTSSSGGIKLSENGSIYGAANNGFETWVSVDANSPITVGQIGGGERHRYLLTLYGTYLSVPGDWNSNRINSFNAQLSVGSNGITLIESLPTVTNGKRVGLVYERPLSGWMHLALIYRNYKPELYINGVLVAQANQTVFQWKNVLPQYYPTEVEASMGYDNNNGFSGMVDEIRINQYNIGATQALTAQMLAANMIKRNDATLVTGNNPPYNGYWTFENEDKKRRVDNNSMYYLLKFEGNVQFPNISNTPEDRLPQKQDYSWLHRGSVVGTGTSYTTLVSQLKANQQIYVLRYTGDNGKICQTSATIKIDKCIEITPNTPQIVCENTPVTLTASANAGAIISWYKVGKTTALATNQSTYNIPTGLEAGGIYYAKIATCESNQVTVTRTVISIPIASADPNPVTENNNVTLKGNYKDNGNNMPSSYSWAGPNGFVSAQQNPVLTAVQKATQEGIYTLTITGQANNLTCQSTATTKLLINAVSCNLSVGTLVSCSDGLGVITVDVTGNTVGRTVEYSIDNVIWQTSNIFNNLLSGDYKVYVRSRIGGASVPNDQQDHTQDCYAPMQEVIVNCPTNCIVDKKLNYDRWDNIEGTQINDFNNTQLAAIFNRPKTASTFAPNILTPEKSFLIRNGVTPNFIARIYGSICPPKTGVYTFYMSADNSANLYINGTQLIAVPDNPNNHEQEYSATYTFTAGQSVSIEVHHKQGLSASFISLKWQFGSNPKQLISAEYLNSAGPITPTCPTFTLVTNPNKIPNTIIEGTEIKAIATAQNGYASNFKFWVVSPTQNSIFDVPKGTAGLAERFSNTNIPVYLRPIKPTPSQPDTPEEVVYRVAYADRLDCYQEIKVKVISQTCDCPTGECDNIALENPAVIGRENFDNNKNYVAETVYLNESATEGTQTITYFDGLGRPIQKIGIQAGPERQDMVQPIVYDAFGRNEESYLLYPVASNIGKFVANADVNIKTWYSGSTKASNRPFTKTVFENSPLNRTQSVEAVGNDKADISNVSNVAYGTNNTDEIKKFTVNGTSVSVGTYGANTLYKTQSTEVAAGVGTNLITTEYKDKEGRVICKDVGGLKTYYVYNDLGQMVCVVPPKAVADGIPSPFDIFPTPNNNIPAFHELIFQYAFNERGLMTKKKVPASSAVEMTYYTTAPWVDMLMETREKRNDHDLITHFDYDVLGRPTTTKITNAILNNAVVKEIFYDEYPTDRLSESPDKVPDGTNLDLDITNLKGMTVGSWSAMYKHDGTLETSGLRTTLYYDKRHRLVQTATQNHSSIQTIDYTTTALDFAGRTLATYTEITHNGGGILITKTKTGYDPGGRPIKLCQKIDQNAYSQKWEPVATYAYNDLGELIQKTLGCRTQVVDYNYNIRGWLETLNNPNDLKVTATKEYDFFGMQLIYTGDGNIKNQKYKNASRSGTTYDAQYDISQTPLHTYTFTYDTQKRIKTANLTGGINPFYLSVGEYDAAGNTIRDAYDENGNIKTMIRKVNGVLLDNLNYAYDATNQNRLNSISDATANTRFAKTSSYEYYADGSLKSDSGKDITFTYAPNALPLSITGTKNYQYTYNVNGGKVQTKIDGDTYDYIGNAVYLKKQSDTAPKLEFVSTSEGRWLPKEQLRQYSPDKTALPEGSAKFGRYEYLLKDHLGNSRVACRCVEKNTATATTDQAYLPIETQTNHYDPWGADLNQDLLPQPPPTTGVSYNDPKNRLTYNGKELQGTLGLFDYGARLYDPNNARWGVIDPLAEKWNKVSPYSTSLNNPISFVDIDGRDIFPSAAFLQSKMGSIYNELMKLKGYQNLIAPYQNSKSKNLYYDVNLSKIPDGFTAVTYNSTNATKINGKINPKTFTVKSEQYYADEKFNYKIYAEANGFKYSKDVNHTELGIAKTIIHETLHSFVASKLENIIRDSDDNNLHNIFNQYREVGINALQEYAESKGLNLTREQLSDLFWEGTSQSTLYNQYLDDMAKKNGTKKEEEEKAMKLRNQRLRVTLSEWTKQ